MLYSLCKELKKVYKNSFGTNNMGQFKVFGKDMNCNDIFSLGNHGKMSLVLPKDDEHTTSEDFKKFRKYLKQDGTFELFIQKMGKNFREALALRTYEVTITSYSTQLMQKRALCISLRYSMLELLMEDPAEYSVVDCKDADEEYKYYCDFIVKHKSRIVSNNMNLDNYTPKDNCKCTELKE